jgi:hypothetical protein
VTKERETMKAIITRAFKNHAFEDHYSKFDDSKESQFAALERARKIQERFLLSGLDAHLLVTTPAKHLKAEGLPVLLFTRSTGVW